MKQSIYRRMTAAEMQRRRWRTTRILRNGNMTVPAGSQVRVVRKFNGLDIEADPCDHCGVAIRVRSVPFQDLEEIRG